MPIKVNRTTNDFLQESEKQDQEMDNCKCHQYHQCHHVNVNYQYEDLLVQLKSVFDLCDTNQVGYITVQSFLRLGHKYLAHHGQDVQQLLLLVDPEGKGYMTFEDFCRGVFTTMHQGSSINNVETSGNNRLPLTEMYDIGGVETMPACNGHYTCVDDHDDHCDSRHSQHSPESYGDTDSAIVVVVPANSESCSGSPEFGRKSISVSDGEEKFECYGEDDNGQSPTTSLRHRHAKGGQPFQKRSTWLRTSLRRSPSERRRMSSSALASQLYRSSSFNNNRTSTGGSRRSSSGGESDDMHTIDLSLEDDVLDLNQRVKLLQQQMTVLANTQNTTDDKYGRAKQENAALTAKVHMLEEQLRELEIRSEDRIREEQQRYKELLGRHERERSLDSETYNFKLQTLEKETASMREEVFRLRSQTERLKLERTSLQDQLEESEYSHCSLRDEYRKLQEIGNRERDGLAQERTGNARVVEELMWELQELRKHKVESQNHYLTNGHVTLLDAPPSRLRDMEEQIHHLKEENRGLREANEELQAQLLNTSIAEGRNLLHTGQGTSLAAEFETMSKDEMMETLREQKEVNHKLKTYIDGILLNILDIYPSILEVKCAGDVTTCPPTVSTNDSLNPRPTSVSSSGNLNQ